MSQNVRPHRCAGSCGSDALCLQQSFELPAESKWVGLNSSLNCLGRHAGQGHAGPCLLPALQHLQPATKHSRDERERRRKDRWAKRARSRPSKPLSKSRPKPRSTEICQSESEIQDLRRPISSLSELSLPSPRREEDDDILSASAVLRAALTGSFLDLEDESVELRASGPPYAWSPYSSSQDENDDSKQASSPQSRDVDQYNHSATKLMRGANPKDRVPLSTLQLLEAEVASHGKSDGYQLPSDRSDRLPCIEGAGEAARLDGKRETRSNAGHPDVWNAPVEDAEAKALKGRPDGPGRLPSYLRPRQAPEAEAAFGP